jgi:hypothetical protein
MVAVFTGNALGLFDTSLTQVRGSTFSCFPPLAIEL